MIPWKEKKDHCSAAAKAACRVGGPSPEGSTDVDRQQTMEPANVHGYCTSLWESLWDKHSIVGVVDFTPSAGYLTESCVKAQITLYWLCP